MAPDTSRQSDHFRPGDNCYQLKTADRAAIIIDADDYFRFARRAMTSAKKRITLIGWDFDSRITVGDNSQDGGPADLGNFIHWLVEKNPDLEIFLLRWDVGVFKAMFRGPTIFTFLKWLAHPRIHTKLDHYHPTASSHHQKIVIVDECLAFCGGIDMFTERWDTRDHVHRDPRRRLPGGGLYKPWHDATSAVTGDIVEAIVQVARDRWRDAGGKPEMDPIAKQDPCWPEGLWTHFKDRPFALARTIPEMEGRTAIHEIEALNLDQIARAKNFIYAESQYFASRKIAEAIAKRLRETGGPEIVIVNPKTAEGWLEPVAMDTARARLIETLRRLDHEDRFRVYHPFTDGGEAIYVHAKISVFDDQIFHIGSANMNNRSMRLDTEADLSIEAKTLDDAEMIAHLRNDLLAEHLGSTPQTVAARLAETGSLIKTIESLSNTGRTLKPYETPDLTGLEQWLADNEVLDPEGPGEMFEPLDKRSLFRGWKQRFFPRHARTSTVSRP